MDPVELGTSLLSAGRAAQDAPVSTAEAAREFEALLLHRLLRESTRPIGGEGQLLDGGSSGRMFRDLFLGEVARIATRRDGIGLASGIEAAEARRHPVSSR